MILRLPSEDDADLFSAWQKDEEVAKLMPFVRQISMKGFKNQIKSILQSKDRYMFIIETEDEIPIGICSLKNIDWINSTAEIDIVIYAKNCWGRGYGCDAVKTLTSFGINDLNLFTIYSKIVKNNERAIKCFQKAGYEIEGTLYNRLFKEGRPLNAVSLSISKVMKED